MQEYSASQITINHSKHCYCVGITALFLGGAINKYGVRKGLVGAEAFPYSGAIKRYSPLADLQLLNSCHTHISSS